jgi:NADPH-dependent 7-cyano-7-deazaguanine reductase QueF
MKLQALGQSVLAGKLEIVRIDDPRKTLNTVRLHHDAMVGICPVTSQPDLYTVEVTYAPRTGIIESKSFKLFIEGLDPQRQAYLYLYRIFYQNIPFDLEEVRRLLTGGQFGEQLAAYICDEIVQLVGGETHVTLRQKRRGNVELEVSASRFPQYETNDEEVDLHG